MNPVLQGKLRPPPTSGLTRTRVDELLSGVWAARLGTVVAPAGSGKTTALAQFAAASRPFGPVAWVTAEAGESDPRGLLGYVASALLRALDLDAESPASLDALVGLLDTWPGERALLVVDDLHTVGAAAELLARLAELAPPAVRILLGSRRELPINTSRIRPNGGLLEVTAADLRFRPWEAEQLFRRVFRSPLPPEELARLTRQTDGWAAGLRLFHLATKGKPDAERRRLVRDLGSRSHLARAYLTQNVLDELPADLAELLIASSPLGRLSGSLVDRFLGTTGSAQLLAELDRRGVFLTALDELGTFRLHEVLRQHATALLAERLGEAALAARFLAAAGHLEDVGAWAEAVHAYCRAGSWVEVTRLLGSQVEEVGSLALDLVPDDIAESDPALLLVRARQLRARGDLGGAVRVYRSIEAGFASPAAKTAASERRALALWTESSAMSDQHWLGPLRAATRRDPQGAASAALAAGGEHADLVAGLCLVLARDDEQAMVHLTAVHRQGWPEVCARVALGALRLLRGRPGPRLDRATVADAEALGLPWLSRLARAVDVADDPDELDGLLLDCQADNDTWGAALISMLGVLGGSRRGPQAADLLAAVDAPTLVGLCSDEAIPSVPQADPVHLSCLGGFELRRGGSPVPTIPLKPRHLQLLRVLAAHGGRAVHRELLVGGLWPDAELDTGLPRLHVAVSTVRRFLAENAGLEDAVVRDGQSYRLALSEHLTLDLAGVEAELAAARHSRGRGDRAAEIAHLQRVLAAHRGPLLPEEGCAEWVVELRDRVDLQIAEAASTLAELLLRSGRPDEAVQVCAQGLRADRYRDALWRQLEQAHAAQGDQVGAAKAARSRREVLAELLPLTRPFATTARR